MKSLAHLVFVMLLLVIVNVCSFHIPLAKAIGTIRILSDGSIDPPGAPISTLDKITYTLTADITDSIVIERNNTVVDGVAHTVSGDETGNGFKLYGVSNVVIRNTNIQSFAYGVYIESATSIVIRENTITVNSYDGIGLFYVSNTAIAGNHITWNGNNGIEMYQSSDNNITGNYIALNSYFGIGIYDSSNNRMSENRVADNYNGIELSCSSGTSVFHNDFVNHTLQVSALETVAVWDDGYPSGGNYWSDYTGADVKKGPNQDQPGSDGIGDTPHNCTESDQDRYPLMQTWTNLAVAGVSPSKIVVGQGYKVYIRVTVQNEGWNAVTTELTVYANATVLSTITNLALAARSAATLNITWQTTGVAKGTYVIRAEVDPVANEPDTRDNTLTSGKSVVVTVAGDITGNGIVDIFDAILLAGAFNSVPTSPNWNANADITSDDIVDIFDAIILASNFNKTA